MYQTKVRIVWIQIGITILGNGALSLTIIDALNAVKLLYSSQFMIFIHNLYS